MEIECGVAGRWGCGEIVPYVKLFNNWKRRVEFGSVVEW